MILLHVHTLTIVLTNAGLTVALFYMSLQVSGNILKKPPLISTSFTCMRVVSFANLQLPQLFVKTIRCMPVYLQSVSDPCGVTLTSCKLHLPVISWSIRGHTAGYAVLEARLGCRLQLHFFGLLAFILIFIISFPFYCRKWTKVLDFDDSMVSIIKICWDFGIEVNSVVCLYHRSIHRGSHRLRQRGESWQWSPREKWSEGYCITEQWSALSIRVNGSYR